MAHSAHFMSSIFMASKNISGIVNIEVTKPALLMIFFVNVEPCKEQLLLECPKGSMNFVDQIIQFCVNDFSDESSVYAQYAIDLF